MKRIEILIADDQAKVRSALRLMLEQQTDLQILGEAVDARGVLDWVRATCPDLLVLDWELRGQSKADLVCQVRDRCPNLRVIALSGQPEARKVALEAGADRFVSKSEPPEVLLAAIDTLSAEISISEVGTGQGTHPPLLS